MYDAREYRHCIVVDRKLSAQGNRTPVESLVTCKRELRKTVVEERWEAGRAQR